MKFFWFFAILLLVIILSVFLITAREKADLSVVSDFEDCVAHGFPIMESHPRMCSTPDGRVFTEEIGEVSVQYSHPLIKIFSPIPDSIIASPLKITGEARGSWFFEASFPVVLTNWDGLIIAESFATAVLDPNDPESTWMTNDFVPFEAVIEFENPSFPDVPEGHFSRRGFLILQKDNPSGLSEHDDALEIPVWF